MPNAFIIINILLFIILFGGYCTLIFIYQYWFRRLQFFELPAEYSPVNSFSIIIPARNEENNIEPCVHSIFQNNYPSSLFEVIVVDDFSDDATADRVKSLQKKYANLQLIQLADFVETKLNSYKKKAIETAVAHSKNEWIITTDADCIVTNQWLQLFDSFIQKNMPVFVAAPVMFTNTGSFISVFQCLDFISLQGITAASVSAGFHSMCNGANLCYKKEVFYEVNGFKDVDTIASGDDMFLMHKIKIKYPKRIGYLFSQNAVVSTLPMDTWKDFLNQRIRWASKATSYSDKKIFRILLLVYLFNLYLLVLPFFAFYDIVYLKFWLLLLIGKTICELGFMLPVANFFKMKKLLWLFPVMQPFHILYTVISGWLGKFGKYSWKGRTVK